MDHVEATKLIPDLQLDVTELEKFFLKRTANVKAAGSWHGAPYYNIGDRGVGYVVLCTDEQLLYFVRYKQIRHNGLRVGRQVLVWRTPDAVSMRPAGFAQHVFFKVLLPKYKALIADQEQTRNGQRFWSYALHRAFQKDMYVYMLDRRHVPNSLTRLASPDDVDQHSHELWGTDEGSKRVFATISLVPLSLRA